ncbi:hypothetical protein U0070_003156 [Myodes glareolus]|uniref:Peptidyl-prolyl cis-trans isomerase n=1 Tax=Myodes glareolus TaxID=447135 RepID=A0AAW0I2F5_MYOGA
MATPQPQRQPCRPKPSACRTPLLPESRLQVKVVGLFKSSSFQMSKTIAETLKNNFPSRFEDPVIVPLQEFAWDQYLQEKKRELKGETWVYSSYVMCFINDQLLGNAFDLKKWAQKVWDVVDVRPSALYEALTLDYSTKFLKDTKASYTDIVQGRGDDGESIYGPIFEDENFSIPHNKRGVLGMVNKGHHTNGSQFYVTLQAAPYLDKKYVAFGQLIEGTEVLKQLELVPTENERPTLLCSIADSGTLHT